MGNKIISILFLLCTLVNCQIKDNNKNQIIVEKEKKMAKKRTPFYSVKIHSIGNYKIFVNNNLVSSNYDRDGSMIVTIPINTSILSSGKQKITIQINSEDKLTKEELINYNFKIQKYFDLDSPSSHEMILDCIFNDTLSKDLYI